MGFFDFATYQWTKGQKNWHIPYNNALAALKDFLGDKGANASLASYVGVVETDKNTVKTEVQNAREGKASLLANIQFKSARVDVEHNADGTHMASASSATDFKNSGDVPSYIAPTQFSVTGDKTAIYVAGRRIKATLASGAVYGTVSGSAFSTVTTVTLKESVLDNTVSAIAYGVVSAGATGSVPAHTHVDDQQGGAVSEILTAVNNIFRLADEMQIQHGGSIGFQNGFSDGFEVDDQQGADRANSTGEDRDISGADKFMKGVDGGTNLNADQDYTTEADFDFPTDTGANNATVAANTVTLSSGSWPANCAGARFKIGANEGRIASRDSAVQITLVAGHAVSGTNASWTIYYHEFASGVVKLSVATTGGGGYGSNMAGTATVTSNRSGTPGNVNNGTLMDSHPDANFASGYYDFDFGAGITKKVMQYRIYLDGNAPTLMPTAFQLKASTTGAFAGEEVTLDSRTAQSFTNGVWNTYNGFANTVAYRYYRLNISAGNPNYIVYEVQMMESDAVAANVINQYAPVFPLFANLASASAWSDENSMAQTETLNSANAWYLEIRDAAAGYGAGTILYAYDGAGGNVRQAVRNNAGTWEYNSNATFGLTTWTAAAVNTMKQAIIDAISLQSQNRMTGANRALVPDSALTTGTVNRGTAIVLYSTVNTNNPQVDQTRVNYDSQRSAMDLRSKAYDPGFSPSEAYLSARIEHSDADGVGTFYVTRNSGTNWETMTEIVQQGLPLTGNIRLFRGTRVFTTGAAGQDARCRYVTAMGKNQYVRHWGLLAK